MNRQQRRAEAKTKRNQVKHAMPSFIVRVNVNNDDTGLDFVYDKTGLTSKQTGFVDGCIKTWQTTDFPKNNNSRFFAYVMYGNNEDFAGSLGQVSDDVNEAELDAHFVEAQDMFMSRYYYSTNQPVQISDGYCQQVVSNTNVQPMGINLGDVPEHEYTNFAVAVAYTRQNLTMAKMTMGDLCPPEADPSSSLYKANFVKKVKQALLAFNMRVDLSMRPGEVFAKLIEA